MKYFVNFIFIFSLLLFACNQPVSLGSRLSMAGPMVNISKPIPDLTVNETDPAVRTVFNVSGTVRDDVKITIMTVTLDYWNAEAESLTRMGREWKWEKQWMIRESEEEEWQPYTTTSYNPAEADPRIPATPPSWSVNKNTVNWNLPITMNRMEQGEYFITVSAWNSAGRHDSQSSAKLKIKYNNFSPTVRIINPLLLAGSGSLSFPKAPEWDEYTFDPFNQPEETSMNLMYYTNSFNDLSYRLEYTISPPTAFSFEITNEHDLDNFAEEKAAYYRWKWEGEEFPPQMGIFTDRAASGEDTYARAGGRIELSDTIKNGLPRGTVTPMQLVTRVKDATGLEEYKSKGWFLYLPDSDKPYPFIEFAHRVHKDSSPPADAAELASMLRGSTNYNNLAYDDDGLKELKWTVYKLKDDSLETERTAGTGSVTFEGNKKEPWPFQAQKSFGTGRFKITVTVQDIYGAWGDEYHGYFTIFSNTTPTVVTPMDSPASLTTTFWGDANGNITIAGRAQIEDYDECDGINHAVKVDDITIAWIKPGLDTANNFRYLDANDPLWDTAPGADFHGNKIWKPSPSFVAATSGNNNPNAQEEWEFSQTINYFNDLGIGMPPTGRYLTDQQFRIRVVSKGGLNALPRSSVYAFTTRGDVTAPVLEFTQIIINNESFDLTSNERDTLPVIAQYDKVKLRGTYRDDSIGQWTGLTDRHEDYLTGFTVRWEGEKRKFDFVIDSFTLDNPDGGNWETDWYPFDDDHNKDPIIQLTAGLTDIGGRRGTENMVLIVETVEPILVRISSDNGDGYYSDYKQTVPGNDPISLSSRYIDIYLEFNKPISFRYSGDSGLSYGTAPHLTLNNNGEAFYLPPGSNENPYQYKITFRYFVDGTIPTSSTMTTTSPNKGGSDTPKVVGSNPEGRLNVTGIVFNSFAEGNWKGISEIPAVFTQDVYDPENDYSLAMQKRIIIDKTPPKIAAVTTSPATNRYGLGSEVYIEVKFDESVQVSSMGLSTYLSLTGGNLAGNDAKAVYQNVKDSTSLNFRYTVANNDDTSAADAYLGVSGMILGIGAGITDVAGNPAALTISSAASLPSGVIIDTVAPDPPIISDVLAASYYGTNGTTFTISGILANHTVEYNINNLAATGWTAYTGTITNGKTGTIALDINGTYQISARQSDTANPPNRSAASTVFGPVRIDKGGILQRVTSSLPDGSYSYDAADTSKKTVTIDLEFRVPVTLVGAATGGTVTLNTTGGSTANAMLNTPPSTPSTKWTFTYAIPSGAHTNNQNLDVTAINLNTLTINDQYGTRVNDWLTINDITSDRRLNNQKKIVILTGNPHVLNMQTSGNVLATSSTGTITFTNGTQLKLTFDRDIYRGNTTNSLVIRQIADGYRIPAVLSETQWNDIFFDRSDLTYTGTGLTVATWRTTVGAFYEKGSNGATPQGTNNLVSDTTVKYVLRFDIDPDAADTATVSGVTMANIRNVFRQAEALSFTPTDQNVSINGKDLTINLSSAGGRPLPVKGARYEWVFPNGFVRDVLGTASGSGGNNNPTGTDNLHSSETTVNGARVLFYNTATDPPVIRVNKDPATSFTTPNDVYRQIKQPLTTTVKINSRTPNATIQFWRRQTTDNVSALLQVFGEDWTHRYVQSYPKMTPQSNFDGWWWGMTANWGNAISYNSNNLPTIGNENYTDGGMIIHLRAQATATGVTTSAADYGYEAAYRSVFVYINQSYFAGSPSTLRLQEPRSTANLHYLDNGTLLTSNRDRVWIRGSNNLAGDRTIPDFPLSRDWTKSRTAKLLTPMYLQETAQTPPDLGVGGDGSTLPATVIATSTAFTESTIVKQSDYNDDTKWRQGRNHWYWVTWGINVPAYIDIFYGELPADANDAYQTPRTNIRPLLGGSTVYKEYYAVFPGRTTVYPVHNASFVQYPAFMDGQYGDYHKSGSPFTAPNKTD